MKSAVWYSTKQEFQKFWFKTATALKQTNSQLIRDLGPHGFQQTPVAFFHTILKHILVHKLPERVGDSMSAVGRSGGRCSMYISLNLCVISAVQVRPSAVTTSFTFSNPSPLRSINLNS